MENKCSEMVNEDGNKNGECVGMKSNESKDNNMVNNNNVETTGFSMIKFITV